MSCAGKANVKESTAEDALSKVQWVRIPPAILTTSYWGTVESTSWYGGRSTFNGKTLQCGMRMAEIIIMVSLPNMQDIYEERCRKKALLIIRDPYNPAIVSCCLLARDIALSELRQPECNSLMAFHKPQDS